MVGREVSKQPPWSIAMSTTTEPVFIAFTIWRDTSLGAAAPATSTAPMTRSAESTCCSTASRLEYTVTTRAPNSSSIPLKTSKDLSSA